MQSFRREYEPQLTHPKRFIQLYIVKMEFEMFVKNESAAELGTSRANMNRTGKTNAAKGVHNNYNEYKDFHSREVESHICASFMEMCGISKIDGTLHYYRPVLMFM